MSTHEKQTFLSTYDWAKSWQDLPWAHDDPTLFLAEICERRKPGRALDNRLRRRHGLGIPREEGWGCHVARFMPKALEFTQGRAKAAGVVLPDRSSGHQQWVVRSATT